MKKFLSLALVLVMILSVLALTACGEDKTNDGRIEVVFYHTMGANLRAVLDEYVKEFEALYPHIKITHSQEGGYDDVRDKIKTQLTVGNQPNIAYCYPDHVAMYNLAGAVVTLDDYINSTKEITRADGTTEILGLTAEQIADFIPAYYEEGRQFGDGLMYTLPMSKSTEVLYYNKTFFDEHNLTLPTTWDDMEALCAKILEIDPGCIPLGYDSESNWFITMCEQLGSPYTSAQSGNHFLFNNDTNKAFVKRFADWHEKGYVTTQEIFGSYTSGLFVEQGVNEDGTPKQRSYMSIGSSAGATHQRPAKVNGEYPFEVGITSIPQANADNKKVISQGPSLCMFYDKDPAVVEATWLFMKFLTTNVSFQAEFGEASGYVPVLKSVANDPLYADFLASADGGEFVAALSAKVCLEQADYYYTSPAFNGSSDARDAVGELLQAAMVNWKTTPAADRDAMIDKLFSNAVADCKGAIGE